jgi:bifunctional DNA-binding transcriptional regulator/antitoxin component of YhaV-PrlF toxin-antitoxin module
MITTKISSEYTLSIPVPFRQFLPPGQEVVIIADPQGRVIIMPVEKVWALLLETFGMWSNQSNLTGDSITYMDEIRRGRRLNEMDLPSNETH